MATLNLDVSEFETILLISLFDMVMNEEQIQNEKVREFIEKHGIKLRTPLTKFYLDSNSKERFDYKRIKGVFDGSDKSTQQIRITPSKEEASKEEKKSGAVKRILKKVLKKEELTIEEENILKENM